MRWPLLFCALLAASGALIASCGEPERRAGVLPDTGEVAAAVAAGFHEPDPERIPSDLATNPGTPWGDYVGSRACERCHASLYARWRGSFHSRTLYDAAEATVFGDFTGAAVFDDPEYAFVVLPFRRRDEETGRWRHYMKIRWRTAAEGWPERRRRAAADTYGNGVPPLEQGTYEVLFAFGNRRHQPYVARWPNGKHWVLPVFWNDVEKSWRYAGFRPYVESCGTCHVTGIRSQERPARDNPRSIPWTKPERFNVPAAEEGWADGAVGCEVCHGPGRAHIEAVDRVGIATYRRQREQGEKGPTIFDGRDASFEHQAFQCGQCHDFFTEPPVTWFPGPDGFDRDPLRVPLEQVRSDKWQFYEDGSHKSPCTMVQVYATSKMWKEGVGCGDCHDPHGTEHWADLRLPVKDNQLCLSCHLEDFPTAESVVAHSHHAPDSPGNRCVECHMPRHMVFTNGVQMMSDRIHSHAFSVPTGEVAPGGPPPSCNICHTDRDAAWTRETIERLWRPETAQAESAADAADPRAR